MTDQVQMLDALQAHKKGLMQQQLSGPPLPAAGRGAGGEGLA